MKCRLPRALLAVSACLLALPATGLEPLRIGSIRASLAPAAEFALGDSPGGAAGADALPFRPILVPGTWQNGGVPGHGIGWYRFRFTLAPAIAETSLAFLCGQIRDADEVWLVDIEDEAILVIPREGRIRVFEHGELARSTAVDAIAVPVTELFALPS